MNEMTRFMSRVEVSTSGCWQWTGGISGNKWGIYGSFGGHPAHRFAFKAYVDDDIKGFDIHHLCENKLCVNPRHLVRLTRKQHAAITGVPLGGAALRNSRKTHCKQGHSYDTENTVYRMSGPQKGARRCRACMKYGYGLKRGSGALGNPEPPSSL